MSIALANEFLPFARNLAKENIIPRRHVSLIFLRGRLISAGQNRRDKTHPLAEKYNYLFGCPHSELDAWTKIRHFDYDKLVLINYRFSNKSVLGMSKPCQHCMKWCEAIFHRMWYSTGNGDEFTRC
mgnify:CR=1 FL=1